MTTGKRFIQNLFVITPFKNRQHRTAYTHNFDERFHCITMNEYLQQWIYKRGNLHVYYLPKRSLTQCPASFVKTFSFQSSNQVCISPFLFLTADGERGPDSWQTCRDHRPDVCVRIAERKKQHLCKCWWCGAGRRTERWMWYGRDGWEDFCGRHPTLTKITKTCRHHPMQNIRPTPATGQISMEIRMKRSSRSPSGLLSRALVLRLYGDEERRWVKHSHPNFLRSYRLYSILYVCAESCRS
jgi:hypothetical protein